jgi:prepilin-type processing-associated H-X9-DG protein
MNRAHGLTPRRFADAATLNSTAALPRPPSPAVYSQLRQPIASGRIACSAVNYRSSSGRRRHALRLDQPAYRRANFVFADGSIHYLLDTIACDPNQQNANKPVPANYPLQNLYFRDDGNRLIGVDS